MRHVTGKRLPPDALELTRVNWEMEREFYRIEPSDIKEYIY